MKKYPHYPHIFLSEQQLLAIIHKQQNLQVFTSIYSEQLKDSYIRQINLIQLKIAYQYWIQQNKNISVYSNIIQKLGDQLKIVSAQQFAYPADVSSITYQTRGFKSRQLETIQSSQAITFGHFLPLFSQKLESNQYMAQMKVQEANYTFINGTDTSNDKNDDKINERTNNTMIQSPSDGTIINQQDQIQKTSSYQQINHQSIFQQIQQHNNPNNNFQHQHVQQMAFSYNPTTPPIYSLLSQQINHLNCLLTTPILINSTKNPMLLINCNPPTNSCILQHQQLNEAVSNIQAQDVQLETNILKAVHSLAQLIYTGFKQTQKAKELIEKEIENIKKETQILPSDKRVLQIQKIMSIQDKKRQNNAFSLIDNDETKDLVNYPVQKPGQLYTFQPDISHDLIIIPSAQHTLYVYPAKRNLTIYETVCLIAEFLRLQTIADSQQMQKQSQLSCIKIDIIANAKLLNNIFIPKYILEYNQQAQELLRLMKTAQGQQLQILKNKYIALVKSEKQKQRMNQLLTSQKQIQEDEQPGDCLVCGYKFDNYKSHIMSMDHIHSLQKEFDNQSQVRDQAQQLQRIEILKGELEELRDDGIIAQAQKQLCGDLDQQSSSNILSQQATKQIRDLLDQWQLPIDIDSQSQVYPDQNNLKYKEDQMLKRQSAMEQILTGVGSRKSGYKRIKQVSELFCQYCADLIHGDSTPSHQPLQHTQQSEQQHIKSNWRYGYNDDPQYTQFTAMVYLILYKLNLRKLNNQSEKMYFPTQQLTPLEHSTWQKQTQRALNHQFNNFGSIWEDQLFSLQNFQNLEIQNSNEIQINENKLRKELDSIEIGDVPNGLEMIKLYCKWKQIPLQIQKLISEAKNEISNQKFAKFIQFDENGDVYIILQNQKMQIPKIDEQMCQKEIKQQNKNVISEEKLNDVVKQLKSISTDTIHLLFQSQNYSNEVNTQDSLQQQMKQNGNQVVSPIIHDNISWQIDKWVKKDNKQIKSPLVDTLHVNSVAAALTAMYGGPTFYQQIGSLIWSVSADVLVTASQCIEIRPTGTSHVDSLDIASLMLCALKARQGQQKYQKDSKEKTCTPMEIMYQDSITTTLYQTNASE